MKVLIITYYWPPAGGPGVQRWLKFVKYFRKFGIEPVVYTPKNPTYAFEDSSLENEIPEDVTVLKRSIFEPYRFAELFSKKASKTISRGIIAKEEKQSLIQQILLYVRGNFFIPDARKCWVQPSVKFLKKYIRTHQIDAVITSGPPHSMHLIGAELKSKTNVKWISDFRDPWTTIGYHHKLKLNKRSLKKHKQLESKVLNASDHVVVTSFTTQKEFEVLTQTPISVITNGYDIEQVAAVDLDSKFTISHIGSLLSGRNPKYLWQAMRDLADEDSDFSDALHLQLVGVVSNDVLTTIKDNGLASFVTNNGYVSHQEAIKMQRSSQLLLLIEIDSPETRCIIPGKLFEYMAAQRPILAIGPKGADIATLLSETRTGSFFEYDQYEEMKQKLKDCFKAYQKKTLSVTTPSISQYSREELTKKMSQLIKNL